MKKTDYLKNLYPSLTIFPLFFLIISNVALSMDSDRELEVQKIVAFVKITPLSKILSEDEEFHVYTDSYSENTVAKKGNYVCKFFPTSGADPKNEIQASILMGEKRISPTIRANGKGPDFTFIIMDYIQGTQLASIEKEKSKKLWPQVISKVKQLHESGVELYPIPSPFEYFSDYIEMIRVNSFPTPKEFLPVEGTIKNLLPEISQPECSKPCHFDLHLHNIFEFNNDILFIDWDCAGSGNLYIELALISVNLRMTSKDDENTISVYFSEKLTPEHRKRFGVAKTLVLLLYAAREFIRPYFTVFPPYTKLKDLELSDNEKIHNASSISSYPTYEEFCVMEQSGICRDDIGDIEIGIILLREGLRRAALFTSFKDE